MRPATATSVALLGITGHLVPVYARHATGRHTVGLVILGPD